MNSIDTLLRQKLADRAENEQKAEEDLEFRFVLKELARRDPIFFFNQFASTYDPRPEAKPNHFPFITYPFQDDYIRELESAFAEVRDLHTDKSRDMGVSWMVLAWIVWHWLFDKSFNALVGSRKEDLVDNFQPDSLFGKMDYLIRRLPKWLLPRGYADEKHRTFCKIVNPESGNTIQGESANRDFSRQGRYTVILLDEFAFWEFGDSVWTATADSAPIRLPVSTPRGKANKFADLKFNSDIKKVSLHWTLHPHKDEKWYQNQKLRRTAREVAQELDIDYEASGTERVFSLRSNQILRSNVVIDPFEVPSNWNHRGALDYGTRNVSSFNVYAQDYDGVHFSIWEWRRNMDDLRAEGFRGSMVQAIAKMLFYDCPYYERIDHIRADPSLWVKNQNSEDGMVSIIQQILDEVEKLRREEANKKNIRHVRGFLEGAQDDYACVQRTYTLWQDQEKPLFKIFKNCPGQILEFEELMWEDWSEAQANTRNIKEKIMDKNNHSWDNYKYYVMSKPAPSSEKAKPYPHGTYGWLMQRQKEQNKLNASKKLRS